ncbi:potassium-transporting ATPase subunit F [Anabaena azotica]
MKLNKFLTMNFHILPRRFKHHLLLAIAIIFALHFLIHPAAYAITGIAVNQTAAWAFRVLALVLASLVIYLFVVIFQPERF